MEKAIGNEQNARYNDELLFLDGIREFHPEVFKELTSQEQKALEIYYPSDTENIPDIFSYRDSLLQTNTQAERNAHAALKRILSILGIHNLSYTTGIDK